MAHRRTIFQAAAMLLLLLAGVEIFACEMLSPNGCADDGLPGTQQTQNDDNCLCCCFHIMVTQPVHLYRQEAQASVWLAPDPGLPLIRPSGIYHPPKA